MTLFIPLSNQSTWDHNELRLSLRSWVQNSNIDKVLIVGWKPYWLTNVDFIPYPDSKSKVENIFRKVKIAAEHSEEFIFANDDHFVLKPLTDLPYYYSTALKDFKGSAGDTFYSYVAQTHRLFPQGKFFDVHTPMICKREVLDILNFKRDILFKSYYCNTAGVEGVQMHDCKVRGDMREAEIRCYVQDRPFISTSESISRDLKKYLWDKYPEVSRFEM